MPFQRIVAFLELDAANLRQEIEVPIVAAHLAISDPLEAGVLLQLRYLPNAIVLHRSQFFCRDVLARPLRARLLQP
jgi:hypothetical protein